MNARINFVVVGCVATLSVLLTGCDFWPYGTIKQQAQEIQQLQQAVETQKKAQAQIEKSVDELKGQLEAAEQNQTELEKQLQLKNEEGAKQKDELERVRQDFEEYRVKYKISARKKAEGEKYETLATVGGRTFAQAEIVKVDDAYVHLTCAGGGGRVPIPELGEEWVERFAYDPVAARNLIEEETRRRIANADKIMVNPDAKSHKEHAEDLQKIREEKNRDLLYELRAKLYGLLDDYGKRHRKGGADSNRPEKSDLLRESNFDVTLNDARQIAREIEKVKRLLNDPNER